MSMQGDKVNREQAEGGFSVSPNETVTAARRAEIHRMLRLLTRGSTFTDICETLYDAGYRKFEIVEDDV